MVDELSIEAARALWAACERQLYPMAVSDSSRYERTIVAVRALANEMSNIASIEKLVAMWPKAGERFVSVVSAHGFSAWSLPQEQVTGAAFALREREIKEQSRRQAQQTRIATARQSSEAWVLLEEGGKIDAGLIDPYRCTEMHVASGLALMSLVQPDPNSGAVIFVLAVIKLDPLTGELLDSAPGIEDWVEHTQQEDFVAHRDAVRDRIAGEP